MQKYRKPLNPEHQMTHLPMSGIIKTRVKRLFLILAGLLCFQVLVIWWAEELSLFESLWLTMTTLVTVGYGDYAPQTLIGRLSTIAVMFLTAITLLTLIVSDYIEYRFYRRERIITGRWIYKMKNHVVIINTPSRGGEQYFLRIATQLRAVPGYENVPILLLTQQYPSGLPPELRDIGLVHYHGTGANEEDLKSAHVGQARNILLLAQDEADPASDSYTFDVAHRLSELSLAGKTTAECVSDKNRQRFKAIGIRSILRPVRTYPEIMVRAVVSPGSEKVLEDMFNYEQDHPHRYNLALDDLTWSDIVTALIRHGIGTALAYVDKDDEIICHPAPAVKVAGKGLFVLVKSSETPEVSVVEEALERHQRFMEKVRSIQGTPEKDADLSAAGG
ncbi:voltage-gated potassium channel [Marinobacter daqiaonensis]|uniref:Voltage-gated potassium channel n=1 Tax=Marinobacter daqiaonensis TaxID=650891 RepID=A0A1I6K1Z9_9GAMM|nr:potassium channel family protein [Marinobacter daqiaonensis]SFR85197.1 voltage-gated potassium channel [Marinobacter daqiaonensis]